MTYQAPVFMPHGGGPLPLIGDPRHQRLISFLQNWSGTLQTQPTAIIVISAHWEAETVQITAQPQPQLLYDYGGFPKETYSIQYPAQGEPVLAKRIHELLAASNIVSELNHSRNWDHGVFVPLKLLYPKANIPIVQVSLKTGLDPAFHIQMGQALRPLSNDNILIVGSGFSYHNMRGFFETGNESLNNAFQDWLQHVCTLDNIEEQYEHLRNWTMAPNARHCHPREEHLLPLMVCAGASDQAGRIIFDDVVLGKRSLGIRWG